MKYLYAFIGGLVIGLVLGAVAMVEIEDWALS